MTLQTLHKRLFLTSAFFLILLAVIAILNAHSLYNWFYRVKMDNFDVVVPGKIYRSALLKPDEVRYIVDTYNIKTIISMAGDVTPDYMSFFDAVATENVMHVKVLLSSKQKPSDADVTKIQTVLHSATNQPVLIHCGAGADRTGWMIGMHRLLWDKWKWPRVKKEMEKHDCTFGEGREWLENFPAYTRQLAISNNWDIPE